MQYTHNMTIDVAEQKTLRYVNAKQGDNASRYVTITITANGQPVTVPEDTTAEFRCLKPDKHSVINPATVNADGTVTVELTNQVLAVPGVVRADVALTTAASVLSTVTFYIQVEARPLSDNMGDSSDEFIALEDTLSEMKGKSALKLHDGDFVLYGDITFGQGWWTASGRHGSNTYSYTKFLEVRPNTTYYITNKPNNAIQGVFYDMHMRLIRSITRDDVVDYAYRRPNGYTQTTSNYAPMFTVTTPDNCYYVSFNTNAGQNYHWTLCSKPIYALNGVGDLIIPANDPIYQAYNKQKLCVIGPSTVMIDRRTPALSNPTFDQYIMGFQEYLMPWYQDVVSYGFSGASWGDGYVYADTYPSIHRMITQGAEVNGVTLPALDPSLYDVYLLTTSTNGLTTTGAGENDWVAVNGAIQNTDTYLGALMDTIMYIFNANPAAKIYVSNFNVSTANAAALTEMEIVNTQLQNIRDRYGITLVDMRGNGFNAYTKSIAAGRDTGWTYDGTHYNQTGSRVLGELWRKILIG